MHSSRLPCGMMMPLRSRSRKWNSLPWDTLSLHSPPPLGPTTKGLDRNNHNSRTHKWALASSTGPRFRSTSRLSFNHLALTLANRPKLRLLSQPPCTNTTMVPAATLVPIRTPPSIPASVGMAAARSVGSSSRLCFSCALLTTYFFVSFIISCTRIACCWK